MKLTRLEILTPEEKLTQVSDVCCWRPRPFLCLFGALISWREVCNKVFDMLKDMVFERSDGGFGESLAYHTPFPRVCYFIDCALGIMRRGGGFEGPVRCGLLDICSTSVDVCLQDRSD